MSDYYYYNYNNYYYNYYNNHYNNYHRGTILSIWKVASFGWLSFDMIF